MKTTMMLITYMIFALSSESCKKEKIEPQSDPIVTQPCNYQTSGIAEGKYYATANVNHPDTITVTFIKDNCPDNTFRYEIKGLGKAFNNYGAPIVDRIYQLNINDAAKYGASDSVKVKLGDDKTSMAISCLTTFFNPPAFSPNLVFKKIP